MTARNDGAMAVGELKDGGLAVPAGAGEEICNACRSIGRDTSLPPSIGLGLSVSNTLAHMMDGTLGYHRDSFSKLVQMTIPTALETLKRDVSQRALTLSACLLVFHP